MIKLLQEKLREGEIGEKLVKDEIGLRSVLKKMNQCIDLLSLRDTMVFFVECLEMNVFVV